MWKLNTPILLNDSAKWYHIVSCSVGTVQNILYVEHKYEEWMFPGWRVSLEDTDHSGQPNFQLMENLKISELIHEDSDWIIYKMWYGTYALVVTLNIVPRFSCD